MGRKHGRSRKGLLSTFSGVTGALLLAVVSTGKPAAAQTMLDRLVQRITKPKAVVPTAVPAAQGSAAATAQTDFRLDIAGVRLGMTPEDARAALSKAGYRPTGSDWLTYGPSFTAQVRREAERRLTGGSTSASMADRVLTRIEAVGPNREGVVVHLVAVAAGSSVVTAVDFSASEDVMTRAALLGQASTKYGRPDAVHDGGLTAAWCPARVRAICGSLSSYPVDYRSLPNLRMSTVLSARRLWLDEGSERARQREREFAAALDRAAPKSDRAAF